MSLSRDNGAVAPSKVVNQRAAAVAVSLALLCGGGCLSARDDLEGTLWRCDSAADCGEGWQCSRDESVCVPAYDNENGVTSDSVTFGMSAALDPSAVPGLAFVGLASRDGIEAYFSHVNRSGGIHGRRLLLDARNDNYQPQTTRKNLERMIGAGGERSVYGLMNVVGTGPSLEAQAFVNQARVLLYAPGSGDHRLEPAPPSEYVFNVRVRYRQETEQLADYLIQSEDPVTAPHNIAAFAQGTATQGEPDAFGLGVKLGLETMLLGRDISPSTLKVATYPAGTIEVREAVDSLVRWMVDPERERGLSADDSIYVGIVMATLANTASVFIKDLTDVVVAAKNMVAAQRASDAALLSAHGLTNEQEIQRLSRVQLRFATLSTVGFTLKEKLEAYNGFTLVDSSGRVKERQRYGVGTLFAMPVPDVQSDSRGARAYRDRLREYVDEHNEARGPDTSEKKFSPDPFSLEGYMNAALLGEALIRHGRDLTTDSFLETLESLQVEDLGFGVTLSFDPNDHQANSMIWASQLAEDKGRLELLQLGLLIPKADPLSQR